MKSYSSEKLGALGRLRELRALYRGKRGSAASRATAVVRYMEAFERSLATHTGMVPVEKQVLDVGCAQGSGHTYALALRNQVIGIDLDVAPEGWNVLEYIKQLRKNGFVRLVKTVGRKVLGIDRQFRRELARQLYVQALPDLDIREMDATRMTFPDNRFDLVFSRTVFQHIAKPAAAFAEIARVLRPGGCAFVDIHLYTSDSGGHDARILAGDRGDLPSWAHLLEAHAAKVQSNSFLNEVRLAEWRELIDRWLPGAELVCDEDQNPEIVETLAERRRAGELSDYSDEELLTEAVRIIWTKPEPDDSPKECSP